MRAALPQFPACAVPRGVSAPFSKLFMTREIAFDDARREAVEGAKDPPAGTVPNCALAAREAKVPIELAIEDMLVVIRPKPAKAPPVVRAPPAIAKPFDCEETSKEGR